MYSSSLHGTLTTFLGGRYGFGQEVMVGGGEEGRGGDAIDLVPLRYLHASLSLYQPLRYPRASLSLYQMPLRFDILTWG
jgi:hypothetical protein